MIVAYLTIKVELDIGDKSPEDAIEELTSELDYDISMESDEDIGMKIVNTELLDVSATRPMHLH